MQTHISAHGTNWLKRPLRRASLAGSEKELALNR